jgi:predicted dehydrogenase
MADALRVGILGGGWPARAHARGYLAAGGFRPVAVADLIPQRRRDMINEFKFPREYATWEELVADDGVDVVSVCLPTHLHAPATLAALRAGKHVVCERPPTLTAAEAKRIDGAAAKYKRVVLYGMQRRFGGAEMAAKQAIVKGYAGDVYHARAVWTRTRAVPIGTGWFTNKEQSGGGALIDLGSVMLDLGWFLLGEPKPASVYAITQRRLDLAVPDDQTFDVEEAAFAIAKFEGGQTLEVAVSWALNQSPGQNGVVCRVHGTEGAVDVYTPKGAVMHRGFGVKNESKETPLKPPKLRGHGAMMRHLRECIKGEAGPTLGSSQGIVLMQMMDAMYKSAESGKSVAL